MSIGVAQLVIIRKALGENGRLVTKLDRAVRPLELPAAERAQLFVTFSGDEALWSRIEAALAPVFTEISPVGPVAIDHATAPARVGSFAGAHPAAVPANAIRLGGDAAGE